MKEKKLGDLEEYINSDIDSMFKELNENKDNEDKSDNRAAYKSNSSSTNEDSNILSVNQETLNKKKRFKLDKNSSPFDSFFHIFIYLILPHIKETNNNKKHKNINTKNFEFYFKIKIHKMK